MATSKRATVYIYLKKGPVPAGILTTHVDGRSTSSEFVYGNKYLERPDAVPVDPVDLPLPAPGDRVEYTTRKDFHIFNGIRDASPDTWGRYLLDKKYPVGGLNEFDYVAASGNDRVGVLAFGETATSGVGIWNTKTFQPVSKRENYLDLAAIQKALDSVDEPDNPDFQKFLDYGPSLGGARPKGTVVWNGRLHLAKFSLSSDSYNMCVAEYACMSLAKQCGINIPNISVSSVDGRPVFLIERFDRIATEESFAGMRVPFHSSLTMTGAHESDYGQHAYWDIVEAITRYSPNASCDRKELFRRMIFNIVCANIDDHMRNHGFLYSRDGQWELSPAYDVVPYPQSTETYFLALHVGNNGREATLNNALSEVRRFGLKRQEAEQIVEQVLEGTKGWKEFFALCGASEQDIHRLSPCFRYS